MKMFTPETSQEFADRNLMLQKSLREPGLRFPIESEYPIVLSADGKQFSFCFRKGSELVAHANLWPRTAVCRITKQHWNIGLIGNVATDESFRGRGIMSAVLGQLKEVATINDIALLVLWSDLLEFYQKQGFRSFGEEIRYLFSHHKISIPLPTNRNFVRFANNDIYPDTLRDFLNLKPEINPSLSRSLDEFRALLSIPCTEIYCSTDRNGKVLTYAVVGKGADMESVVHEWGATNADDLISLLHFIMPQTNREALMLLTPVTLGKAMHAALDAAAVAKESHHMALVWVNPKLADTSERLEDLFIWGLDSI